MSHRPIPKPGAAPHTTSTHDVEDWRERAACLGIDPEMFFPESRGVGEPVQTAEAKAVCGRCPVRDDCLQEALAQTGTWGVWGGELLVAGAVIEQRRRRPPTTRTTQDEDAA